MLSHYRNFITYSFYYVFFKESAGGKRFIKIINVYFALFCLLLYNLNFDHNLYLRGCKQ